VTGATTTVAAATAPAERIRDAVLSVPGVADMHSGTFGQIVTHLPGRRVRGVRINRSGVQVHVVVHLNVDIPAVAQQIRAAAVAAAPGVGPYTVVVEDVAEPQTRSETASFAVHPENVSRDMFTETRKS
jgi:uncharacterized alkaline shock family protein YloU